MVQKEKEAPIGKFPIEKFQKSPSFEGREGRQILDQNALPWGDFTIGNFSMIQMPTNKWGAGVGFTIFSKHFPSALYKNKYLNVSMKKKTLAKRKKKGEIIHITYYIY